MFPLMAIWPRVSTTLYIHVLCNVASQFLSARAGVYSLTPLNLGYPCDLALTSGMQ